MSRAMRAVGAPNSNRPLTLMASVSWSPTSAPKQRIPKDTNPGGEAR